MRTHSTLTAVSVPVLVLVLGLTACHGGGPEAPDPAAARATLESNLAPREIRMVDPEVRDEQPSVALVGNVRAFDTVLVAAEVAGRVERVAVEVADHVSAGQVLAEIDRETYGLQLAQAEAQLAAAGAELELAERALERKRDLLSDHTIAQSAFDQAKASYDLAVAQRAAAESAVGLARTAAERSVVRAPSDGIVIMRTAVRGQWADVGNGLIELAVGTKLKVTAQVPSHWVPYLQGLEGFDFTVREGEATRHAKLYSIDPIVDQSSRSFEIVGTTSGDGLKPGLFATVDLTSPETVRSLWIPATAVVASDTPRIMRVLDGKVEVARVQTGRRDDGMVEVTSGLEAGEPVIANVAGLARGLPVKVVE